MHIGLIGLGKMGNNMRARLEKKGIEVTGYDTNPDVSDVATVADLVAALPTPRVVWIMVPAGPVTDAVVNDLEPSSRRATSSSTAATRASPKTSSTPSSSPRRVSTSWTPASPAVCGVSRTATA